MKETLITFQVAKLAKEKGFGIPLYTSYINGIFHKNEAEPNGYDGWDIPDKENWNKKDWVFTKEGSSCFGCKLDNIKYFEACSAPTQSLLQKWLREVHNIDITVMIRFQDSYGVILHKNRNIEGKEIIVDVTYENSKTGVYKEALEVGLFDALKLIK